MGRTLHFEITNSSELTEPEKQKVIDISKIFNTGKFKDVWTCENFHLSPQEYHPNWAFFKATETEHPWRCVNARYEALEESGLRDLDIIRQLHQEQLITYDNEGEISGFCKVAGNEYNASLVYAALILISEQTAARITLTDEGEYLLTPVLITNGKAKPWAERAHENWTYWQEQGFLETNEYGLADKMKQQNKLIKQYPDLTNPGNLSRQIDPEDFKNHPEYSGSQIMAGFHGEHFGLTDIDPEAESLQFSATMQTIGNQLGYQVEAAKSI